MALQVPS